MRTLAILFIIAAIAGIAQSLTLRVRIREDDGSFDVVVDNVVWLKSGL